MQPEEQQEIASVIVIYLKTKTICTKFTLSYNLNYDANRSTMYMVYMHLVFWDANQKGKINFHEYKVHI